MDVKKFRAKSMHEALAMVRAQFGPDAAVLQTRELKSSGLWRLVPGAREIEITASSEIAAPSRRTPARQSVAVAADAINDAGVALTDIPSAAAVSLPKTPVSPRTKSAPPENTPAGDGHPRPHLAPESPSDPMQMQISELRDLVDKLTQQHGGNGEHDFPPALFDLFTHLIDADVSDELARQMVSRVREEVSPEALEDHEVLRTQLAQMIEQQIATSGPIEVTPGSHKTVALIGPTGVGKTTTIAKLAANFRLREKRRVGLITVDTYRIAAVEQLRTYADIIDLPMEVVSTPREMRAAIAKLSDLEIVLIDTAGRSPRDEVQINELRALLREAEPDEVHLVLSAVSGANNLVRATEQFSPVQPSSLILTKLDEATVLGNILPLLEQSQLPLSYVTDGQNVPDDIEPAKSQKLGARILGLELS